MCSGVLAMLDLPIDLLIGVTALAVAWFGYQEFTATQS